MYKNILVKDIHKVRLIELNRPKSLNALNKELLKELAEILNETDKNKKIRCVVITGNEKSFSSGADMKEAPESEMPFWAEKNRIQDLQLIIMAIIVYSRNQTEYFRADLIETQFMNRNLKARTIDSF